MTTFPRLAVLVLLAGTAAAGASGCAPTAPDGPPPTVEQLSAKVGCSPRMQVDAGDLRRAYCKTPDGEFYVVTFTSRSRQDAWLNAVAPGSPHLAGHLWTVTSRGDVLGLLQERLGGDLRLSRHGGP
ncbi:hypothetical protein [Nonomuraea aridisoli]|uniref:hypothetical protein n=1 Tax=Nonomuraea aridisoli TaxID=2070368 RepID=UPI0015E8C4A9|nr:hypothetical protein [Nonomuraea aridisoli]